MTTTSNRGECSVCREEFNLTAKGEIRTHGPKTARCSGSAQPPATEEQGSQDVDDRPTASQFRQAQVALGAPGQTVPEGVEAELLDVMERATKYGVRPDDTDGPNPWREPVTEEQARAGEPGTPREAEFAVVLGRPLWPGQADAATGFATGFAQPGEEQGDGAAATGFAQPEPKGSAKGSPKAARDDQPHRIRKGPEKTDFDQWGRYKIPDPVTGIPTGRQRVTTFAKTISDQWGLSQWQQRMLLKGAAENPDVVKSALGLSVKGDVNRMEEIAAHLKDVAGDKVAASRGTAFHEYSEDYDLGRIQREDQVPEEARAGLTAYAVKMAEYRLFALPDFVERTTVSRVLDVAGTLDRILRLPNGDHVIGDVKTGQDLKYAWLDIGIQLACYAHGINENGIWDWDLREWLPAPKVRTDYAIVMHAPAGGTECTMYRVDLELGWANAILATQVRDARKVRTHSAKLDPNGPEYQEPKTIVTTVQPPYPYGAETMENPAHSGAEDPLPPMLEVQPPTAAFSHGMPNGNAATPLWQAPLPDAVQPADPGVFIYRMGRVTSPEQAAEVYGDAVTAGVATSNLPALAETGTVRLAAVDQALAAFRTVRSQADAAGMYETAGKVFGADDPVLPELVAAGTKALSEPPF